MQIFRTSPRSLAAAGFIGFCVLLSGRLWGQTVSVTNTNGNNSTGSLGAAVSTINADGGGTIDFSSIAGSTINQTALLPALTQSVTLLGNNVTISGPASVVLNLQNAVSMTQLTLDGALSVSIAGSGSNVDLRGGNSFSGGISVSGSGLVNVAADNNLGAAASTLVLDSGTLQTAASVSFSSARTLALTSNGGTFDTNGQGSSWNGTIQWSSASSALTVTGGGVVTFAPPDTGGAGVVYPPNTLVVNGGSTFTLRNDSGGTEFASNFLTLNNGTFQVYGTAVTNFFTDYQGIVTLGPGGGTFDTAVSTETLLACSIGGTGTLTASGPGTLALVSEGNPMTMTYTGGTDIKNGSVVLLGQNNNTGLNFLGPGAVTLDGGTISDGFTQGVLNLSQNLVLTASGGKLDVGPYQIDVNGVVSGAGALTITAGNPTTLSCYDCNGVVNLNAVNTYGGGTYITGKTLLNVITDSNLGASGTPITMDTGNIQTLNGDFATSRDIYLVSEGGIEPESHRDGLNGIISGPGFLLLKDGGWVTLGNAANSYSGGTTIVGFTIALVGTDSAFGSPSGGITLDQGAIQVTAGVSFNSSRIMSCQTYGGILDANGFNNSWNGLITGVGEFDTLSSNGDGSVTLTQQETYAGGTNVADFVIDGGGGPPPPTAGHTTLVLAVPGALPSSTAVSIGWEGILDLNGLPQTIGSLDGQPNALVAMGAGSLNVGNNDNNSVYAGAISGTGNLTKVGTGTLTLDGVNTYTGGTDIQNGAIEVGDNASPGAVVAGPVTVESGAILEGFGTVAGAVTNKGMVEVTAPSGALSITQLNDSNASQTGLQVLPANYSSSRFNLGSAALAGALTVTADPGSYAVRYKYVVVSSGTPLAGNFSGVSDNLSYMTPTLHYGSNAVTLVLFRNNVDFTANAITSNQIAAGAALNQSLGVATDSFFDHLNALYLLSPDDQRKGLTQMGGSSYCPLVQIVLNQNQFATDTLWDHFEGNGFGPSPSGAADFAGSFLAVGNNGEGASPAGGKTIQGTGGWWAEATGNLGSWNGNANVVGYNIQNYGAITGFRSTLEEDLEGGVALDFNQSNLTSNDGGSVQATVTSFTLAGYENQSLGPVELSLMAEYGLDQYKTTRTVTLGTDVNQPQSSFGGNRFTAALQVSANLTGKSVFSLMPKAGVEYAHLEMDGFTETNAGSLDLTVAEQNYDSLRPFLGLTALRELHLGKGAQLMPSVEVTASREMENVQPQIPAAFDGAQGVTFTSTGATGADPLILALRAGAQLSFQDNWNFYANYTGDFGWGESLNAFNSGLALRF